jgi:hypothetical protein
VMTAAGGGRRWLDRIGWILEATAAGGFVMGVMPRLMMDGTFVQGTPGTNMTKDNDLLGKDYVGLRLIRIGGSYTSTS